MHQLGSAGAARERQPATRPSRRPGHRRWQIAEPGPLTQAVTTPWQGHQPVARALPPRKARCGDTRRWRDHVHGSKRRCSAEEAYGGGSWRGLMRRKAAATRPTASRRVWGFARGGHPGCGAGPASAVAQMPQCLAAHQARLALAARKAKVRTPTQTPVAELGSGWTAARFGGSSPAAFQTRVLPWLSWTRA